MEQIHTTPEAFQQIVILTKFETNKMEIPSVNISPRVLCGKTTISVTQFNTKQHCRDFARIQPQNLKFRNVKKRLTRFQQ